MFLINFHGDKVVRLFAKLSSNVIPSESVGENSADQKTLISRPSELKAPGAADKRGK